MLLDVHWLRKDTPLVNVPKANYVKFKPAANKLRLCPHFITDIFALTMALNCSTFSRLILGAQAAAEACTKRAVHQTCGRYRVCRWYSGVTHEENKLEQVCVSLHPLHIHLHLPLLYRYEIMRRLKVT